MIGVLRNAPVAESILQYLTPMDYWSLRNATPVCMRMSRIYPTLHKFTLERACAVIRAHLKDYTHGITIAESLIQGILDNHLCLTGGFLLSVLTGVSITRNQDIDFVYRDYPRPYQQHGIRLTVPYLSTLDGLCPDRGVFARDLYPECFCDVMQANTCFGSFIVQCLIPKNVDHSVRWIVSQFDLSVVRNYLSATDMLISHPLGIVERTSSLKPNVSTKRDGDGFVNVAVRAHKYIDRGYTVFLDDGFYAQEILDQPTKAWARCWNATIDLATKRFIGYRHVLIA